MRLQVAWTAGIAVLAGIVYVVVPSVVKIVLRRRMLARVRRSGLVCLTFDDGPEPDATPQLLDVLDREGVRATFFLVGENVEAHPEIVARIRDAGHAIGEHTHWHTHAWKTNPARSASDLRRGARAIAAYTIPGAPILFRPPYGKLNLVTLVHLARRSAVFWSLDPRDYEANTPQAVARFVTERLEPGAVVLLHDGRRNRGASDPQVTVAAVETIIDAVRAKRLRPATVHEAFAAGRRSGT